MKLTPLMSGDVFEDGDVAVFSEPTANCQLFSIGGFASILDSEDPKKEIKEAYELVGKPLLLVDVRRGKEKGVEKLFGKKDTVFKNRYTNGNGSKMTMYLLKTKKVDKW
jgi:hypothetical protein